MKRFIGRVAICALALAGLSAGAMPLGVRTMMQGRAAVRQVTTSAATWTVTFDANGGTGSMAAQTFTNGIAQALSPNAFVRFGYAFVGWAESADGEAVYADGQRVEMLSGRTLYAKWTEIVAGSLKPSFSKAQTATGILYDRSGRIVGTVQVKNVFAEFKVLGEMFNS